MGIRELIGFVPRSPEYILSIPHAGVFVPEDFRDRFKLGEDALVEIDLYSDLCYEMAHGMHVRCELAPFFVDMNRAREGAEEEELPRHLANPAHEHYTVEDTCRPDSGASRTRARTARASSSGRWKAALRVDRSSKPS